MNLQRKQNGEFAHKPSIRVIAFRWVVFLGILGFLLYTSTKMGEDSPIPLRQASELEQVMDREEIKRQYELLAKETLLKEKLQSLEQSYTEQKATLEAELEGVRKEKISFQ
jgi:hypothetical protein